MSFRRALAAAAPTAIRLLETVGYRGAATVELLLSPTDEIFFLEVNARIQVEQPVTEEVRGVVLVVLQLRLAAGELPPDALPRRDSGHAIETRLVAEDPDDEHRPASGELAFLKLPEGPGIRIETGYRRGDRVTPDYDGLLAKVVVSGSDRAQALARLRAALAEVRVLGLATNLPLLRASIDSEAFVPRSGRAGSRRRGDQSRQTNDGSRAPLGRLSDRAAGSEGRRLSTAGTLAFR